MKKHFSLTIVTTILVILATVSIAFFMVFDRTLKTKFDQELFFLLFRFLLTLVLAGLGILAYRLFTIERDLRKTRRADMDFIYRELRDAHLQLVQAIHKYRAELGYDPSSQSYMEREIDSSIYNDMMAVFLQSQLIFRSNSTRIRDYKLGYADAHRLADQLRHIDRAIVPLIEEFEAEQLNVRNPNMTTKLSDLPELADFLNLKSKEHPFSPHASQAFESGILGLSKARHRWDSIA